MIQGDLATVTGGRAFYSDNDLSAALDEAIENGANYYSLTYSPTNPNYNGSLRNIRVSLARPRCQLQYRRSYYADDPYSPTARQSKTIDSDHDTPEQFAVNAHERPLYAGLQHGAPLVHQLVFKVRVHAVGGPTAATDEQLAKLSACILSRKEQETESSQNNPDSEICHLLCPLVGADQANERWCPAARVRGCRLRFRRCGSEWSFRGCVGTKFHRTVDP
jgi:hypothetical protein